MLYPRKSTIEFTEERLHPFQQWKVPHSLEGGPIGLGGNKRWQRLDMIGIDTLNGILRDTRDTIFLDFFLCSCCGPMMILATSMIHFHSAGWYCVYLPC